VLVNAGHEGDASELVRNWIVDWETAQLGDPAWDLAGALQDFLVVWVLSMPLSVELTSSERIARAARPLADLRPPIAGLWEEYRRTARLEPDDADKFLDRAVRYSAARLIQTVYELLFMEPIVAGPSVLLLQIAANLLAEPLRGQVELFGINRRGPQR
jgi:hypothetical protein